MVADQVICCNVFTMTNTPLNQLRNLFAQGTFVKFILTYIWKLVEFGETTIFAHLIPFLLFVKCSIKQTLQLSRIKTIVELLISIQKIVNNIEISLCF